MIGIKMTNRFKIQSLGFTVLFAVLVASVVLAMALGIANIANRELLLSSSAREAHHAFFAADTGYECALYWDDDSRHAFDPTPADNLQPISCNGFVVDDTIGAYTYPNFDFKLRLPSVGTANPDRCAIVSVNKAYSGPPNSTRIISRGYNVPCASVASARAVERLIEVRY